jgi:hypothetical protein
MPADQNELDSFHSFASHALPNAGDVTLEHLLAAWRTRQERDEAISSIRRGIADAEAGRLHDLHKIDHDVRAKLGVPPRR